MIAFLSALPIVGNIINALVAAFFNAKVQLTTARIGGDVAVAKAIVTAEVTNNQTKVGWLSAIATSPVLSFVVCGFAFPFIVYLNKVIVWDICFEMGSTPALKDPNIVAWGNTVLTGIFITSGVHGVANAYFQRNT